MAAYGCHAPDASTRALAYELYLLWYYVDCGLYEKKYLSTQWIVNFLLFSFSFVNFLSRVCFLQLGHVRDHQEMLLSSSQYYKA